MLYMFNLEFFVTLLNVTLSNYSAVVTKRKAVLFSTHRHVFKPSYVVYIDKRCKISYQCLERIFHKTLGIPFTP